MIRYDGTEALKYRETPWRMDIMFESNRGDTQKSNWNDGINPISRTEWDTQRKNPLEFVGIHALYTATQCLDGCLELAWHVRFLWRTAQGCSNPSQKGNRWSSGWQSESMAKGKSENVRNTVGLKLTSTNFQTITVLYLVRFSGSIPWMTIHPTLPGPWLVSDSQIILVWGLPKIQIRSKKY